MLWASGDNISNLENVKNWHRDNRLLFGFLFLSTSGAAASFLLQFKRKRGELANGKAAWDGMVAKYQNSTRQRRRMLKQQLNQMAMTNGQEPDIFTIEEYFLRDELVDMGEVFNDDSILDRVLEGLTEEYLQIKYSAGADDHFTLDRAVITMRIMYANKAMRNGPSRNAKGREFGMVVTSTPSTIVTCSLFKKPGRRFQNCFKRKGTMPGKNFPQHLEKYCVVACIIPIATITATVGLKSETTTKTVALVPVNKMAGIVTTAVLTPIPQKLHIQQRKWKLTSH